MAKFQILPIEKELVELAKSTLEEFKINYSEKYTSKSKNPGDFRNHKFWGLHDRSEEGSDYDGMLAKLQGEAAKLTTDYVIKLYETGVYSSLNGMLRFTDLNLMIKHI